jgi:hypothetical protein
MLKYLRRWLGWETDSDLLDVGGARPRPAAPKQVVVTQNRPATQAPAAQRRTASERTPPDVLDVLDVLDDPRLSLDKPPDGFDPYNTGAFNRSASWERIGRQRKA